MAHPCTLRGGRTGRQQTTYGIWEWLQVRISTARADERWRRRCRPGAPPLVRSAAGRRGAGCGRVGQAECGASGGFLRLAWCMVGGGCRLYWEGPVSPCVVSVGLVRTSALLLRSRPLQTKKNGLFFLRALSRNCLASCGSGPYDLTHASRVGSDHFYEV